MINSRAQKPPTDTNTRRNSDEIRAVVRQHQMQNQLGEPLSEKAIRKLITPELAVIPNVVITPEIAAILLTFNDNRPVRKSLVARFTRYMKEGKWIFAGNTVKFDWDLKLRDAQHTLLSIIASGTTQVLNIQTGLDPASFAVMDTGGARSAGDVLAMKGIEGYNTFSAAIKTILFYEGQGRIKNNIQGNAVSNRDVDRFSDKKPEMRALTAYYHELLEFKKKKKGGFLALSTWLFLYYILGKIEREQAQQFVSLLSSGENISMLRNAPIYLLREHLTTDFGKDHLGTLRTGGSAVTELKIKYIFRAWNAWRDRERITKLVINKKEDKLEIPK